MAPLTQALAHEVIVSAEQSADLLRFDVDGWAIWPLFRTGVAARLTGAPKVARTVGGAAGLLAAGVAAAPALLGAPRATYFAKTYSSGLLDLVDGRYRDIWFDDLLDGVGDNTKILGDNNPAFTARIRRAANPPALRSESIEAISRAIAMAEHSSGVRNASRALATAANEAAGRELLDPDVVGRRVRLFIARRRTYGALFARIQPSVVLVADAGEHDLVAAAKEAGAWVLELQHGINDRHHAGYSWTEYARPFRPAMPVPDLQLLYGEHWKAQLAPYGFWGDDLRVVGSPRIDIFRSAAQRVPDSNQILFTSQGIEPSATIGFLRRAIDSVRGAPIALNIRLHPVYDTRNESTFRSAFAGDPRVTIDGFADGPSTVQLLSKARVHVSVSSAAHYEAIALRVPTVVLPLRTHETVDHLVDTGLAMRADDPELLAHLMIEPGAPMPSSVSDEFFAPGALANARREIASISLARPSHSRVKRRGRGMEDEGHG